MQIDLLERFWSVKVMTDKQTSNIAPSAQSAEGLILAIAKDKCRASFAQLFKMFAPRIKSFVIGKGLSSQEAEELAQDAMLIVWRKADYYDPQKAAASTWIFTIARNLRIDMARKQGRVKTLPEDLWHDFDEKSQEDEMQHGQSSQMLKAKIANLPDEQKELLMLSFYENMSHGEIAKSLGLPLGTVKSRLRLALSRLRNSIDKKMDELL